MSLGKLINAKIFLIALLGAAIAAAFLGIGQIWFGFLDGADFTRALITIIVIALTAGFLSAINYDLPVRTEKFFIGGIVLLSLFMAGLLIAQIWWAILDWASFSKIFGTAFILFALAGVILVLKEDFGSDKKLRDEHYYD